METERIIDDDRTLRLRALLAERLAPATLALFRDLPAADARLVADLLDGGKKLRALLALAVCDALGGDVERALASAAAIECVHAASLIHDDLVDGDRTRRDRPATWVLHGGRRAVLVADMIFATALLRSAELGRREMTTLARAIAMLAAGAYGEPLEPRHVDARDAAGQYDRTIALKTGSLFSAAAELGAIAAASTITVRRAAADFGARIGEAFQIADDVDDVVAHADAPSPQQQATLAMLIVHFGERDPDALERAMRRDIDRRVMLARGSLARMPVRANIALLHALAATIVGATPDAPPVRTRDDVRAASRPEIR